VTMQTQTSIISNVTVNSHLLSNDGCSSTCVIESGWYAYKRKLPLITYKGLVIQIYQVSVKNVEMELCKSLSLVMTTIQFQVTDVPPLAL
jgi:hypothetical protein